MEEVTKIEPPKKNPEGVYDAGAVITGPEPEPEAVSLNAEAKQGKLKRSVAKLGTERSLAVVPEPVAERRLFEYSDEQALALLRQTPADSSVGQAFRKLIALFHGGQMSAVRALKAESQFVGEHKGGDYGEAYANFTRGYLMEHQLEWNQHNLALADEAYRPQT